MYLLRFTFCDSKAIFVLQFNREICTIVIYLFGIYYERKSDPRAKSFTLWFSRKAVTNQLTDMNEQADCLDNHTSYCPFLVQKVALNYTANTMAILHVQWQRSVCNFWNFVVF